MNARTHIVIPSELVSQIDKLVGKRGRSQFLHEAARKELKRLQQVAAVELAAGSWKAADHPELKGGVDAWVRKIRKESDRRIPKS